MAAGRSLTLYWSKNGNTERVARRIHAVLEGAGLRSTLARIDRGLAVEYRDFSLIFCGAPVYENLPPEPVIDFLKRQKRRGVEIALSAPEVPNVAAVVFCTYGGGHTGFGEAVPMLKYAGQFFQHEGIRVVDEIAVPGSFPEADERYNREGRLGDLTGRPDERDLVEVEARVLGILRRLCRVLPLGELRL